MQTLLYLIYKLLDDDLRPADDSNQDVCHEPCVSTGCLSRDSYHCIVEPIKKAQLPQKVAREASYSAPLLPYAGPKAPHSC